MKLVPLLIFSIVLLRMTGIDLALYQSYAWIDMIHDRTEDFGVSSAIESTFSGDQPCQHCLAIQHERENRNNSESVIQKELDSLKSPHHRPSVYHDSLCGRSQKSDYAPYSPNFTFDRYEEVLTPPPRLVNC